MKKFDKLVQANIDRHNKNPELDTAIVSVLGVVVATGIAGLAKYVATKKINDTFVTGQFANHNK